MHVDNPGGKAGAGEGGGGAGADAPWESLLTHIGEGCAGSLCTPPPPQPFCSCHGKALLQRPDRFHHLWLLLTNHSFTPSASVCGCDVHVFAHVSAAARPPTPPLFFTLLVLFPCLFPPLHSLTHGCFCPSES